MDYVMLPPSLYRLQHTPVSPMRRHCMSLRIAAGAIHMGEPSDRLGFFHEVGIPYDLVRARPGRRLQRERGEAIDQATGPPVHQFLADALKTGLSTRFLERSSSHGEAAVMRLVQETTRQQPISQAAGQPFNEREITLVLTDVRVMEKPTAVGLELQRQLI